MYAGRSRNVTQGEGAHPTPPKLADDHVQLYSYFSPALEPGSYNVAVTQDVSVPGPSKQEQSLSSHQKFHVVQAPRFSLPRGAVHSTYPALGHRDTANILPHVVLNDPQLPWDRWACRADKDGGNKKSRAPWLAVLVFSPNELQLPKEALSGQDSIFPNSVQQSPDSSSIRMKLSDLFDTRDTVTPIDKTDPDVSKSTGDIIFIQKSLFRSIFTTYTTTGKPKSGQSNADVTGFKYLAHVKNINTKGMVGAGVDGDRGLYSVVISIRTGPIDITQPTRLIAHLISIEGVENLQFPISRPYVALSSLHSWNYECLPTDSIDLVKTLRYLGSGLAPLRAPSDATKRALRSKEPVERRLGQRLASGYTLARYRLQTGDETVAFIRGPCIPSPIGNSYFRALDTMANFSTSFQILDQTVGIIDLSYSTAWQLGKSLAIADQSFATALGHIRTAIYGDALKASKEKIMKLARGKAQKASKEPKPLVADQTQEANLHRKKKLLRHLKRTISYLQKVAEDEGEVPPDNTNKRWQRSESASIPSLGLHTVRPHIEVHAKAAAEHHASSLNQNEQYNGFNIPRNTDWSIVLQWILGKMFLADIPSRYLVTDPSFLPKESIRFFHVDRYWVDALIDGALSIANHLEHDDFVRRNIKLQVNSFLDAINNETGRKPQIPTYGIFIHSALFRTFPDLCLQAPTLRQEMLTADILLCLFDQMPSPSQLSKLVFYQPPHQQCFSAAGNVTQTTFNVIYKKIYTTSNPKDTDRSAELGEPETWKKGDSDAKNMPYDWDSRCLIMNNYAQVVYDTEAKLMKSDFLDTAPTSEMMGIHLGHEIFKMTIEVPDIQDKTQRDAQYPEPDPTARTLRILNCPSTLPKLRESKPGSTRKPKQKTAEKALSKDRPGTPVKSNSNDKGNNHDEHVKEDNTVYASKSFFELKIFPARFSYYNTPFYNIVIPSIYPTDIVFSLPINSSIYHSTYGGYHTINICSISLTIPIGDDKYAIFKSYNGTGGTMISNMAFYLTFEKVVMENYRDGLKVMVLPKFGTPSLEEWKDKNRGLSFMVYQVRTDVAEVEVCEMTIEERYIVSSNETPDELYNLVLRSTANVKKQ